MNVRRRYIFSLLYMIILCCLVSCGKETPGGETPTAAVTATAAPTNAGEATPDVTAPPEIFEYNPSADRMDALVLSSELDKYSYEGPKDGGAYDVNYRQTVEAEDGVFSGNVSTASGMNSSGSGYAEIHDAGTGDAVTVSISVPASGTYHLVFLLAGTGHKENYVMVDGETQGTIANEATNGVFVEHRYENVYLEAGEHTITLSAYWGWVSYDSLRVEAYEQEVYEEKTEFPKATLSDVYATEAAQRLYQFINDINGLYTISGQYAQLATGSNEFIAIKEASGRVPAMVGLDLIEYSPSRAAHGTSSPTVIQKAINFWNDGGIVTMCWHWNAPERYIDLEHYEWWEGFRSEAVDINLDEIVNGQDEEGLEALYYDIDTIAFQLKRLQDAGVPILWRPLHEASGGWFWWGEHSADTFIKLWRLMYERLVEYHGLHNLIWVWNGQAADWYPGDDYVDIIGEDLYPGERVYASQQKKYNEANAYTAADIPVALTENGCLFDPDLAIRDHAAWTWFCVWSGEFVVDSGKLSEVYNEAAMWDKVMNHEYVITLDELPDLKTYGD